MELKDYKGDVYKPMYGSIADARVYLKSEADKLLADKDKEIVKLKEQVALLQAELAQNQEYNNG